MVTLSSLFHHLPRSARPRRPLARERPNEEKRQADARILMTHTTHTIALRPDPPLPRALRPLHRPNASSGPRELPFGHINGRRLAAGTTRERHGPSARRSSRMSLSTLRARAMELISRGMEQDLPRSARATYLENAYGSATHRVLSDGAEMSMSLGHELACAAVVPPPT